MKIIFDGLQLKNKDNYFMFSIFITNIKIICIIFNEPKQLTRIIFYHIEFEIKNIQIWSNFLLIKMAYIKVQNNTINFSFLKVEANKLDSLLKLS